MRISGCVHAQVFYQLNINKNKLSTFIMKVCMEDVQSSCIF